MQIQTLKRLIMLTVLSVLTTASAHAQAAKQFMIPFDFCVGDKTLPAGQYLVGRSTQASAEGLVVRATEGRAGVFALTRVIQAEEVQQDSKLVFRRYGDQYFLAEVWISGGSTGRALPSSGKERSIARGIAKRGGNSEKVAIVGDKH